MSVKKKVLLISSPLTEEYGGGERFLEQLVSGLPEFEFVFLGRSRHVEKYFVDTGRTTQRAFFGLEPVTAKNLLLLPVSWLLSLYQLIRFAKMFKKADIILLPAGFTEDFTLVPFLLLFKKKIVQLVHANRCPRSIYASPLLPLFKFVWSRIQVVFVSQSQALEWQQKNLLPAKYTVIYNGVKEGESPKFSAPQTPVQVGYLGRLHEEKGVDILLKSLERLQSKVSLQLTIAGSGPQEQELQSLATRVSNKTGISINFAGFQNDPSKFLESLSVSVFPSNRESFGLVLIESLERGIPMISSNLPQFDEIQAGLPEIYKKLRFPSGDEIALAKALDYFLENRAQLGGDESQKYLHKYAVERFGLKIMLQKYRELLN